jgi:FAD/FMN-containing dehydrogenase
VGFEPLGGAVGRVGIDETAFRHRAAPYAALILATWTDAPESSRHIQWAREAWTALRPFSTGGVYVNYLNEEEEDRVKAAYGANHDRLVALKNTYDPTNLFRLNQNIKPTL